VRKGGCGVCAQGLYEGGFIGRQVSRRTECMNDWQKVWEAQISN